MDVVSAFLRGALSRMTPTLIIVKLEKRSLKSPKDKPAYQEKKRWQQGKCLSPESWDLDVGHRDIVLWALGSRSG